MRERGHSLTWLILKLTEVLARDVHIRAGPTGCDSKFAECRRRSCTYSKLAALRRPVACKVHRRWRSFRQLTIHCDARADQSRSDILNLVQACRGARRREHMGHFASNMATRRRACARCEKSKRQLPPKRGAVHCSANSGRCHASSLDIYTTCFSRPPKIKSHTKLGIKGSLLLCISEVCWKGGKRRASR